MDGNIHTITITTTVAGWVAWRHDYNARLRSTIMYSRVNYDHALANTGALASVSQQSLRTTSSIRRCPRWMWVQN